jgi:hypothetical protein
VSKKSIVEKSSQLSQLGCHLCLNLLIFRPSGATWIDRALSKLADGDITQEELEEKAKAAGVPWQALSYAITRELER